MIARAARRLLHCLLLLIGVSCFSFLLVSAAPGNFFDELKLNPQISSEAVAALKTQYGIDQPLPVRYLRWVVSAAHGDFGYSMSYRCPVASLLWARTRNTLLLAGLATLLAWIVALSWGTLQALHRGEWIDHLGRGLTAVLLAIPELLISLLLLLLAARTGWFPTGGMTSATAANAGFPSRLWDATIHLFLPVMALTLGAIPVLVRHVRSAMIAVLDAPFIEAARGHGIPRWRLLFRYALPAASNSLISLLGFSIGALTSLSLLVEIVLSWPGLGPLVLEAVLARDVYVVIAAVMLSSFFLVIGSLLADVLLYWADPRIRLVQP
jgi:peptide/nickel transport system permease protein